MFNQGTRFRLMGILMVVSGLVIITAFTPVIPWLRGVIFSVVETPQPTVTPTESPTAPPAEVEPSPPEEVSQPENAIIISEEELQSKVDGLINMANQSGAAKIEYIRVKLEQDRMLVSAKGEAMGREAETEDMEVRFEGKTVFASGKVRSSGLSLTLTAEAEINTEAGKPSVEVERFSLGNPLVLKMFGLSRAKVSGIINDAIESRGLKLPVDLESIRIEDGKLIVVYK